MWKLKRKPKIRKNWENISYNRPKYKEMGNGNERIRRSIHEFHYLIKNETEKWGMRNKRVKEPTRLYQIPLKDAIDYPEEEIIF